MAEGSAARAEQGLEWVVIAVVLGFGILLGVCARSWLVVAAGSLFVGIALNFFLLARAVARSGKWDRFGVVIFGAIPAGVYDGVKVCGVGLVTYWIVGFLR